MNEVWFRARMRAFPRPVVVLDVSAAAAPLWPVLHGTLDGLAEVLPEAERPDVAFLGGAERVPLARFLANADELHAANAGRGRVVSPLLESFRDSWPAKVVLLAVRPLIDLADWRHTSFAKRLSVVRLDPTVAVANGACAEEDLTDVAGVVRLVGRPATTVRLRVPGGLPVAWDDPAFRFDDGQLVADAWTGRDVAAGFLCGEESELIAEVVRGDGTGDPLPAEAADPPPEPAWAPLTSAELTLLDTWRTGRPAHCPHCGADHLPGVVACADGGGCLPSLARVPSGGFVRVRLGMFQASCRPERGPTLREGDVVAVRAPHGARPRAWRFDGEWRPAEAWALFERIGDEFALAVPPVR